MTKAEKLLSLIEDVKLNRNQKDIIKGMNLDDKQKDILRQYLRIFLTLQNETQANKKTELNKRLAGLVKTNGLKIRQSYPSHKIFMGDKLLGVIHLHEKPNRIYLGRE